MSRRDLLRTKVLSRCKPTPPPEGLGLVHPCQLWTGPTSGKGRGGDYGRLCVDGATMATHIVIWTIENGPIPPRKQLDHLCMRRNCCEETHLEMVTHRKNQRRRAAANKKRKQNGPRDHTRTARNGQDDDTSPDGGTGA